MILRLDKVCKSFGDVVVLDNFSAVFNDGINFLIGESGKGKTTVLRLILGLEKADSGEIDGLYNKMSAVFQENRLFENMTIEENVKYVTDTPLDLELVSKLCLKPYLGKEVSALSGGTKRRVEILRALSVDADLVIMDEPFTGLDDITKIHTMDTIMEYSHNKMVIISTHDKYAIKYIGNSKNIVEVM